MKQQITITLESTGQVSLSGPMENAILFYGMLEAAKEGLREYHAKKRERIVSAVPRDHDLAFEAEIRGRG